MDEEWHQRESEANLKLDNKVLIPYICPMELEKLYSEASTFLKREGRILFRGFAIEIKGNDTVITDIRSPYYNPVSVKDLRVLTSMGFVVGTTYLLMESDLKKIDSFKVQISKYAGLLKGIISTRKRQEYLNTIARISKEIDYYKSQVGRWQKTIEKHGS